MHIAETEIKVRQEELTQLKQSLAALTKKEGGNLLVRDYTDDIYLEARNFE